MTSRDESSPRAPSVLLDDQDGVRTLTLNRPRQRNGLNRELSEAFLSGLVQAAQAPEVRCIVINGAGPAFCAGDDLATVNAFLDGDRTHAPAVAATGDAHYLRICEEILSAPKPVIVGVHGAVAGAGTEIACAADYRLASTDAQIGSGLVRVGHVGNAAMLPRVVGAARATEIFLTGRLVAADEAQRIGLVDRVVPDESLAVELCGFAAQLAAGPTKAIAMFKELRERAAGQPALFALRLQDRFHIRSHSELADGTEGPRAFLERRAPRFSGA